MGGLSGTQCLRTGEGTVARRMKKSGGRHVNHTDCEAEMGMEHRHLGFHVAGIGHLLCI